MKLSKADFRKCLAAFLTIFTCGYTIILTLCEIPEKNMGAANNAIGFFFGVALSAIIGVYFGGTEEEPNKPETDNPPANKEPKDDRTPG